MKAASGAASLLVGLCLAMNQTATAQTPIPRVEGPIPVTASSYPFGAADHTPAGEDLGALGYVEEEYYVSGRANVYDWPETGAVVNTPSAPYTTRLIVRRPRDRERFSGNVVVEMLNPSNLFDLNIGWALSHTKFVRDGDAWIGVTAKPISVVALKHFDSERYGRLSWDNPIPAERTRGEDRVSNDSPEETENGLVWDIYSQVSAWLRSRDPSNPFLYGETDGAHPVEHLYGFGYSQTGSFLYTYINAIHPLVVESDGRAPYDGYIVATSSGPSAIRQGAAPIPPGDPRREFHDAGVPIIRIMTQSDFLRSSATVRDDSDTPGDGFRNWEIAGAAHATPDELIYAADPGDVEKAGVTPPPLACNEGPRSRFPNRLAFNAALHHLDVWVRSGTPAPRAQPIAVENGEPVLDEFGNMRGGVRSPLVDVPTATWTGSSTGPSFCRIAGHEIPFSAARLAELYPTHGDYVRKVTESVEELVRDGFLLRPDGDWLIGEAERADVP